jgi:uncharacterized damage-inducible protein DinB
MDKTTILAQYDYNYWANGKVWECVMQLTDEQFDYPLEYSIGSIRTQCVHTMGVESWWFHYLKTGEVVFLNRDDYTTRQQIRARWEIVEADARAYLDTATPANLRRTVKPPHWDPDEVPVAVWEALFQVANHSTDHRAQILAGLHKLGAPTVAQDFLDYIDETRR